MAKFSLLRGALFSACLTLALTTSIGAQTAGLKSLCEKYVLDCPIPVNQSSHWTEIAIAEKLLQEYLKANNPWISSVTFDGTTIVVNSAISAPNFEARELRLAELRSQLDRSFAESKTITLHMTVDRGRRGYEYSVVVSRATLKARYRSAAGTIDYDKVWSTVFNIISEMPGQEVDSASLAIKSDDWKVSTLPVIFQKDGFVTKYFLTVSLQRRSLNLGLIPEKPIHLEAFVIETLVRVWRRRASSSVWSEIRVGDQFGESWDKDTDSTNHSSLPLFNKIREAIQQ